MTKQKLRIGIQGVKAAFHHLAAVEYFAGHELELVECATFRRLCEAIESGATDFNMMAIENSIAGSILPNYLLLEQFRLRIVGEIYLRIEMCLMSTRNQKLKDIKTVHSHPMALLQCQDFLSQYPYIKAVESNDTAESAKEVAQGSLNSAAAIASALAAEVYNLEILAKNIESDKSNYTRFLVVSNGRDHRTDLAEDKSSLRFEITHRPGSLLSILSSFVSHGLNMTKLQSVPIIGKPSEYSFHVDLEWQNKREYAMALEEIKLKTLSMIEFGCYKKDGRPRV